MPGRALSSMALSEIQHCCHWSLSSHICFSHILFLWHICQKHSCSRFKALPILMSNVYPSASSIVMHIYLKYILNYIHFLMLHKFYKKCLKPVSVDLKNFWITYKFSKKKPKRLWWANVRTLNKTNYRYPTTNLRRTKSRLWSPVLVHNFA